MNEARGVSARGGRQLIARVGDLRQQAHGFGAGGPSRRGWHSTGAIACLDEVLTRTIFMNIDDKGSYAY